jgi:hypothetical protein
LKIVREHINEKFVEDSDPVTDMGIGTRAQISRFMKERNQVDTDEIALAECAEHGKLEWVKFLIAAGADVHFINDYALRWASHNGYLEVVKELLKAGADVHSEYYSSFATTALEAAKNQGHQDVVDFLKDYIAKEKKAKKRTVRESLLEKFVEDSDPVTDMGIGLFSKRHFKTYEEFFDWFYLALPYILNIPDHTYLLKTNEGDWMINTERFKSFVMNPDMFDKIRHFLNQYITINDYNLDIPFNALLMKRISQDYDGLPKYYEQFR